MWPVRIANELSTLAKVSDNGIETFVPMELLDKDIALVKIPCIVSV
jgi:hypothetical protein